MLIAYPLVSALQARVHLTASKPVTSARKAQKRETRTQCLTIRSRHHSTATPLPRLLYNVVADIASVYSAGCGCCGQLKVGKVCHLSAANDTFERRSLWSNCPRHRLYPGGFNSPESSFFTPGSCNGSGRSQSTQRNLRPPVWTSMNLIGLPHFAQAGGGVFLAMGARSIRRERYTLSHR